MGNKVFTPEDRAKHAAEAKAAAEKAFPQPAAEDKPKKKK